MKYNNLNVGEKVLCNGHFGIVKTLLPYSDSMIEVRLERGGVAVDSLDVVSLNAKTMNLSSLYRLWDLLGEIPTFSGDFNKLCIEESFGNFRAGTQVEEIWKWFESKNKQFLVGEVMSGKRLED